MGIPLTPKRVDRKALGLLGVQQVAMLGSRNLSGLLGLHAG